jgi:hypothetical protein
MKIPSSTLKIKIKEQEYELKYPNIGGLIDIQIKKINYTKGSYSDLEYLSNISGMFAKYSVDMISSLEVFCPDIFKKLPVTEWDLVDVKALLNVYLKEVLPWSIEWDKFLNYQDEE